MAHTIPGERLIKKRKKNLLRRGGGGIIYRPACS